MIFNWFGKLYFSSLSPILLLGISLLPFLYGLIFFSLTWVKITDMEEAFSRSCVKGNLALERKKEKDELTQKHSNVSPYFLYEQIESYKPLEKEKEHLASILHHPALQHEQKFRMRFNQINEEKMKLHFIEESIRTGKGIKESEEKQVYPIEMESRDIKELLTRIEGPSFNDLPRPQLIITDFHMKKKKTNLETSVYELEMQLLKREFSK